MSTLAELAPLLGYAVPPLLGAFIGYLTNRVAIRMLFRPLHQWRVGRIRVPMTPGVIPAQRHQLAVNIGEMVGEQLLTSEAINHSLRREGFQDHLASLIESKIGSLLKQDLGPLPSLIPPAYKAYFDIGYKTLNYRIKETVHQFLQTQTCATAIQQGLDSLIESLAAQPIENFIDRERRAAIYTKVERSLSAMFASEAMERWLRDFIGRRLEELFDQGKSLQQIVPASLQQLIIDTIRDQTPFVLQKLGDVVRDEDVREKLIGAIGRAIEDFIETLGPMAGMIKNFVKMDQVEEKIRHYLDEKQDDIEALLHSDEIRYRVAAALVERTTVLLATPLPEMLAQIDRQRIAAFGDEVAHQIVLLLRGRATARTLAVMIEELLEDHLEQGRRQSGQLVADVFGPEGIDRLRQWLQATTSSALQSPQNRKVIDRLIGSLLDSLIVRPVGRLDHIIPAGVRDGLYRSTREMATAMLVSEVPGVVKSIDISRIVTEKIDSFDLLQVERLLLSIMQEQFKYINLFGALLGFIIGCANLFVLVYFSP
jgi:uncharacterized membrane protein YheB (UPF0754 family)